MVSPLAQGGYGALYVAEQIRTEKQVALKVLWPHILESTTARESFELEARVAARIQSEHIVQVIDAGIDAETQLPFLVMELLSGEDLEDFVARHGPLAPEHVFECLRQSAIALDRAHGYVDASGRRSPIVHRDLKPENLFLTRREDGSPWIKVLDFGVAKVLSASATTSQDVKGTPLYMAFEQASRGTVTPMTDVWALGLIAFFLLTGSPFWLSTRKADAGMAELFGEILALPIPPPSERALELGVAATFGPEFDAWFLRCVDRDPTRRFQSAGEAIQELGQALGIARPSLTPPPHALPPLPSMRPANTSGNTPAGGLLVSRSESVPRATTWTARDLGHRTSWRWPVIGLVALATVVAAALGLRDANDVVSSGETPPTSGARGIPERTSPTPERTLHAPPVVPPSPTSSASPAASERAGDAAPPEDQQKKRGKKRGSKTGAQGVTGKSAEDGGREPVDKHPATPPAGSPPVDIYGER